MKMLKTFLILSCLTILSACSTNPSQPSIKVKTVTIPESLLQEFCEWKKTGETVGELADAYVSNTLCGQKYEAQVKQQKEYLKRMKQEI